MNEKYIKDFEGWLPVKEQINNEEKAPTFKEREIWWCSIGINVGYEMDGKNRHYNRPVLIVRKFNTRLFWGVPLTTQVKDNPYYFLLDYQGKDGNPRKRCVMLSHLRLYDSKRLHDKMGRLSHQDFENVRDALRNLI